ncbi:hypothetical protein LJC16_03290 [Bacteroidales bacterium OttesenSCG-928-C19]|nr:hypothetical protein [Bacteroidales bacterium OttesenSCG-928-C19]
MKKKTKVISITVIVLLLIITGFTYYKFFFVFGEGVKGGRLNFVVKKGYVFKTYEGRLIQDGIKSENPGMVESNEFNFSVKDKDIAEELMLNSGHYVELYYKEYKGKLPWRGNSKYVVDKMIIEDSKQEMNSVPLDVAAAAAAQGEGIE